MSEWESNGFGEEPKQEEQNTHESNGEKRSFFSDDAEYAYRTVMRDGRRKTMGWSVASLVAGILSVVCCCFGYTGVIFGIAAVVFSAVSRKKLGYFDGMSIAGLILGIFGFVFGISMLVMTFTLPEEVRDEIYKSFKEAFEAGGGTGNAPGGEL